MHSVLEMAPRRRFVAFALIATWLSVACGGSAVTSGDHNVGAGASGGEGAMGGTGSTGAGPNGGSAGKSGKSVQLSPGSWQMTGVVTQEQVNPSVQPCDTATFTLNVSPNGSGYSATIGQGGFIDGPTAEITNGNYVLGGFYLPCGNQVTLSGLTLQGSDTDGDGKADALTGTVVGMAYSGGGDAVASEAVQIAFTGVPDVSAPTVEPPAEPVSPLVGFLVSASEPLTAATSLALSGTTNVPLTAQRATSSSQGVSLDSVINWSTSVILPLSGQWAVQGTGQDLIGHALEPGGTLKTLADPGVFAQDGFEGVLIAAIESGTPAIVTGLGSVTAISGAHSLWIAPGDAVTFHLRRMAGEKTVLFSARAFSRYDASGVGADIRAGVVGGQQLAMSNGLPSNTVVDTGDATWKQATEVVPFILPVTEPGTDVLLRVSPFVCQGFCGPSSALMIDDLTLE